MQINGMGSGHGSDAHQITGCMHNQKTIDKQGGAAGASQTATTNEPVLAEYYTPESSISFTDWLQNTLSEAKRLFGKIWNGEDGNEGTNVIAMDKEEGVESGILHTAQVAAASEAVPPPQVMQSNPYFSAIEDTGRQQQTIWQKIKIQFESIRGYLTRHFSFSNRNFFQGQQESPKEDLSRKSKYRKDDLEIDCVLTDESYLMDSYNKKGEYSKLAGEMLPKGSRDLHL